MAGRSDFPYFAPQALDAVMAQTDAPCECCGAQPGELYKGPFYAIDEIEYLCLDCIASGRAAARFGGSFNDVGKVWEVYCDFDREAGAVTPEVLTQVRERTPGYESWQGNTWLFHCGDGGVFHGDATEADIAQASPASREHFERNFEMPWNEVVEGFAPGGHDGIYHFKCRHCGLEMFHWDCG